MEFAAPSIWSEAEGGWLASMGGNGGWPVLGSGRLLFSLFPSNRLRRFETLFADDDVFPCSARDGEVSILLVLVFIKNPWPGGDFSDCGEIDLVVLVFIFSRCVLHTQFWGCEVILVLW